MATLDGCNCPGCIEDRAVQRVRDEQRSPDSGPSQALKKDDGKLRYDLISPEFESQLAKGLTHGAQKYDDFNYLKGDGLDLKRPLASLRRHLAALQRGEDFDPESGTHHAACVAINAMFLYDLMVKKGKKF